ncbi:MAG: proline racemase family protein, partial [Chloroflexia bacterium]|nr:proline racemase family protein [Chloroflexia bacterium]
MLLNRIFSTIDAHAAGQPLRIITHGVPPLPGVTLRDRRERLRTHHDDIRRLLLHEPRGHADMYGAVLTRPSSPDADYGVIFMTNGGYSTMCGHGIIALTTALIETGAFPNQGQETRITYETPAGVVQARASVDQGRVRAVRFRNVPAFRLARDLAIDVRDRPVTVDVAFGGAWYAIVSAEALGLSLRNARSLELIDAGMAVKHAVGNALEVVHPLDAELAGMYGTIITGPPVSPDSSLRNVTIYADGAIDRSPCGTGTSALIACRAADGELAVGDSFVNESIIDTVFTGRIVMDVPVGEFPGV